VLKSYLLQQLSRQNKEAVEAGTHNDGKGLALRGVYLNSGGEFFIHLARDAHSE
jgi:hypothetical protein